MRLSASATVLLAISCALCTFANSGPAQPTVARSQNWQQPGQVSSQPPQAIPSFPPEIQALSQIPSFPDQSPYLPVGQQQIAQPLYQENPPSVSTAPGNPPALQSQYLPPIYPLNSEPQNGYQNPYDIQQNFRVKQSGNRNDFNNVNARQGVASAAINRSFIAQSDNKNLANNVLLDQRQTGGKNLGWVVQKNNNNLANFANIRQIRAGEGEQFARIVQDDNWRSYNVAKTQQAFKNTNYGNIAVNTKMQGLKTQALAVKTQYIDLKKNKEMREKVAKMLGIPVPPDEEDAAGQDSSQPQLQPESQQPQEPQQPQQPYEDSAPAYPPNYRPNTFQGPAPAPLYTEFPTAPQTILAPPKQTSPSVNFNQNYMIQPQETPEYKRYPPISQYTVNPDSPDSYVQQVADVIEPNDNRSSLINVGAAK